MDADLDTGELDAYIADLGRVPDDLRRGAIKVGEKAALNIKTDWARTWSGHSYIEPLSRAINYDREIHGADVEWEIGPDKGRAQGPLGNIIEYGSVNNPPIPGGAPALARETPKLERHLGEAAGQALNGD